MVHYPHPTRPTFRRPPWRRCVEVGRFELPPSEGVDRMPGRGRLPPRLHRWRAVRGPVCRQRPHRRRRPPRPRRGGCDGSGEGGGRARGPSAPAAQAGQRLVEGRWACTDGHTSPGPIRIPPGPWPGWRRWRGRWPRRPFREDGPGRSPSPAARTPGVLLPAGETGRPRDRGVDEPGTDGGHARRRAAAQSARRHRESCRTAALVVA